MQGPSPELGCVPRTHPGRNSKHSPQSPHLIDGETEAGDGEVPYSPSVSWCEAEPGWNPSLSEAPHHTLLLKAAQRGCAECWGVWVGRGWID